MPEETTQRLGKRASRRLRLVEMAGAEKNRLGTAMPRIRSGIECHLRWLGKGIETVEKEIAGVE